MSNTQRITIFVVLSVAAVAVGVGFLFFHASGRTHKAPAESLIAARETYESIPDVPQRALAQSDASWHAELKEYANKWREFLAFRCTHAEKMLRSYEFLEVLFRSISEASDSDAADGLQNLIDEHQEVVTSLSDPEGLIAQAWAVCQSGDTRRGISLLTLLVDNPGYESSDIALLVGYLAVEGIEFDLASRHLLQIVDDEGYQNNDLARLLLAWSFLRQARLQEARNELERLVTMPGSRFSNLALDFIATLKYVTEAE